jgi:hypothetical protein
MRFLIAIFIFTLGSLLAGCAIPPAETTTAIASDLVGECHKRFIRGVFGDGANASNGYQYTAGSRRAFAIGYRPASDGFEQVCGHGWGGWATSTEEQVDKAALDSCNRVIPNGTGCVVYARGNDVVYDRGNHQRLMEALAQRNRLKAAELTELQELEKRLAAQAAEAQAAKRRQQELEVQLAAVQSTAQATLPSAGATVIRTAHALVIGNAAYPGSARLDNPVNDANAISQKLRSMGFTVTTVTDANRQRLVQAMAQFRRSAASADLSLLFYSGHGVQIFGTNYILPTDVDQTDTAQATIQGVPLNGVIENFMPGKTKIVFLDACRDNPLQRTGDRSVTKGLAPISVAEGTLISYATKDGQVAADGVGSKNSPFTQALLEHLADPQDIGVVLRKVREKVMRATGGKQQPWDYGSLTGGELVLSRVRTNKP